MLIEYVRYFHWIFYLIKMYGKVVFTRFVLLFDAWYIELFSTLCTFCTHSISLPSVHVILDYLFSQFAVQHHIISCTKFQKQLHCIALHSLRTNLIYSALVGGKNLVDGYNSTAFSKSQTMYYVRQYILWFCSLSK